MFEGILLWLQTFGYIGVFFAGFLSTFSLFIPSPTFLAVFFLANTLDPLFLGILGGLGAAVGEMIGYLVGYGAGYGAKKLKKEYEEKRQDIKELFKKYKPEVIIFLFSAAPVIPFDIMGLFCGAINYDKKKFFILTVLGKIVKYLAIAYAGFYGMSWILNYFGQF